VSERIREVLRKAVRESSAHGSDVRFDDTTPILAEGIIDSMGIFGVMTEIENVLGCTLPPEEISAENFRSIDALSALVQRLMDSAALSEEATR
jgi:acyl carrier protein